MKKVTIEIALSAIIVFAATVLLYSRLAGIRSFWDAQFLWSIALIACWIMVSMGYYRQGWLVHTRGKADEVSILLPIAVFLVQCILFVKGIYYWDWSLIAGAIIVNSGVAFSMYQIAKAGGVWPRKNS